MFSKINTNAVPTLINDARSPSPSSLSVRRQEMLQLERSKANIAGTVDRLINMVHKVTTGFDSRILVNKISFDGFGKNINVEYIDSNAYLESFDKNVRTTIIKKKLVASAKQRSMILLDDMPDSPFEIKKFAEETKRDILGQPCFRRVTSDVEAMTRDQIKNLRALYLVLKIWSEYLESTIIPDMCSASLFLLQFNHLTKNTYPARLQSNVDATQFAGKSYGLKSLIDRDRSKSLFNIIKVATPSDPLPKFMLRVVEDLIDSAYINAAIMESFQYYPGLRFKITGNVDYAFIPSSFFTRIYYDSKLDRSPEAKGKIVAYVMLRDDTVIPESSRSSESESESDHDSTEESESFHARSVLGSIFGYGSGPVENNTSTLVNPSPSPFALPFRKNPLPKIGINRRIEDDVEDDEIEEFESNERQVTEPEDIEILPPSNINGPVYAVENVVAVATTKLGEKIWRVKWAGYDSKFNTWETRDKFDCDPNELLSRWRKSIASKRNK